MYTKKQKPKKPIRVTEREREKWVEQLQESQFNYIVTFEDGEYRVY